MICIIIEMKKTFGEFISEKRLEKCISLRTFSNLIDISPEYLSKIENGLRAAPRDEVLNRIADKLSLPSGEKEKLFDLAAESKSNLSLASDLVEYIHGNEIVHKTLRLAKRCRLSTDEWQDIFDFLLEQVCTNKYTHGRRKNSD